MKTGDLVRDVQGRSFQVGPMLGRGLWGKSFLCRAGDNDSEFVLKVPLSRADFRGDTAVSDAVIEACTQACVEQAALLQRGDAVFLPPLQGKAVVRGEGDPSPALLIPRYATTLDRRISQGCTLAEVLGVVITTTKHLRVLADRHGSHGNLRPGNILLNDRGEVFLTDLATPAELRTLARLHAVSPEPSRYLAPELLVGAGDSPPTQAADTFALGMILYRAVMTPRAGDPDGRLNLKLPTDGLDKAALVSLRDRVQERVKQEDSNPRFHARLAERLASVINRAISRQTSPSPPYRFATLDELLPRLEELRSLIRPTVQTVGKVLLQRPPNSEVFESDEEARFSVTVGASAGVDTWEEIACGIALFNAETEERLRDTDCAYTVEPHPSGRFRFAFRIKDLGPGRYRARLAFLVRDSGHAPVTTEITFEVRAAAGYVPPPRTHAPTALPFERGEPEADTATRPRHSPQGAAPQPIAAAAPEPAEPTYTDLGEHAAQSRAGVIAPPAAPAFQMPPPQVAAVPAQPAYPATAHAPAVQVPSLPPAPALRMPAPSQAPARVEDETLAHLLQPGHGLGPPRAAATSLGPPSLTPSQEFEQRSPPWAPPPAPPRPETAGDILKAGSWTELPLPGAGSDADLEAPDLEDAPEPRPPGPLRRFVDMIREDTYLLYMSLAGVAIFALLLILYALDS